MKSGSQPLLDESLHSADIESLERRIMDLALTRTGSRSGALFLWDSKAKGLALDFHVVESLIVNLPGVILRRRTDGRRNGIAFWVFDQNEPYLCADAERDPNYARYFLDVLSIAAVPIPYQERPIGVLSVSSRERGAFTTEHVEELEALAASAAKFLRRAQLYRSSRTDTARPFLIKGLSPAWLEVERRLELASPTDAPVLIQGESGTGKELVAHAIHFNSQRASRPFVAVNCAAIPETLLESVLFGHVRGAFTGASFHKIGEFQKADGGTLFLDEVGELPMMLQAKVLRAVEQGEIQPLGSNKAAMRVDVRLVCATHRDLPALVREHRFRDDLYYRLSVMTMDPPLRSYKDNLEVLSEVFVRQAASRHRKRALRLTPEALTVLHEHDFPGNVRELKNALEHAVIMAAGDDIRPENLPATMRGAGPLQSTRAPREPAPTSAQPGASLHELREQWLAPLERRYLSELLASSGGNVREAAMRAGVNTVTLYRLLKRRGLALERTVRNAPLGLG